MLGKNVISPFSSIYYVFSVNYSFSMNIIYVFAIITCLGFLVGWLCLTSHRQPGRLETAPPFTVPCKGREAR